jgi:hypothetical protein
MSSKAKKFNWRFLWSVDKSEEIKNGKIDEMLDSIAFLRAKVLADIETVRARVDGEDLWFTCYQRKKENSLNGERK